MNDIYLFGIDIGGTSVKTGLFTDDGTLLEKVSFKSNKSADGIIDGCCKTVKDIMFKYGLDSSNVIGIGVGVPGPVDDKGVVHSCINLKGWNNIALTDIIEARCKIRTTAQNDANAAACGEYWQGAGKGSGSMAMVTLGTGVGGAVITDGRLMAGAHNTGGELGHICVNRGEKEMCSCGRYGCLEQYASASGIVRMAKEELLNNPEMYSPLKEEDITAEKVFYHAANEDAISRRVFEKMTKMLGFGLSVVSAVCDPHVIVLGGGVSLAGDMLLDEVKKRYRDYAYRMMADTEIVLSELGADSGIYGAAYMALLKFR